MRSWIEDPTTIIEDPTAGVVAEMLHAGDPFWLDIEDPSDEIIDRLADALTLHPLAVADSKTFGQRGKMQVYGDVAMMVGFGLDADTAQPIEVHCYDTASFLITLRRQSSATLDELHRTGSMRHLLGGDPIRVLHHLFEKLHGEFPPYIDALDERLGALEADVLSEPRADHLVELAAIKQEADSLRRRLVSGRDLAGRSTTVATLPGTSDDSALYVSDLRDELHQIVADLSTVAERCLSVLSVHASLESNRQGEASRQLAAVATVFLPITFVVGFFGMNFSVLVNDLEDGWLAFALLGILLNIVCVVGTAWWLSRRGWR